MKSFYICWPFNFLVFICRAINKFKIPTKYLFPLVILHIIWNPQIQVSTNHRIKPRNFVHMKLKWFHSIYICISESAMYPDIPGCHSNVCFAGIAPCGGLAQLRPHNHGLDLGQGKPYRSCGKMVCYVGYTILPVLIYIYLISFIIKSKMLALKSNIW